MSGFAKNIVDNEGKEYLVLPSSILNKWMTKFTSKIKNDPYFYKNINNE